MIPDPELNIWEHSTTAAEPGVRQRKWMPQPRRRSC